MRKILLHANQIKCIEVRAGVVTEFELSQGFLEIFCVEINLGKIYEERFSDPNSAEKRQRFLLESQDPWNEIFDGVTNPSW